MVWELRIPVLTTGHVTREISEALFNWSMGDTTITGVLIVAQYDGGFFVRFDMEDDDIGPMAPCVQALREWAIKQGYQWVRLDADGDTVALPLYDW